MKTLNTVFYAPTGAIDGQAPRAVKTIDHVKEIKTIAEETSLTERSKMYLLKFELPDNEHEIIKGDENRMAGKGAGKEAFNPPFSGFTLPSMDEVRFNCECHRVYQFPAKFARKRQILCSCPAYLEETDKNLGDAKPKPVVVIMHYR